MTEFEAEQEIIQSKSDLEQLIGKSIDAFGWVGGEISSYSKTGFFTIKKAGYSYSFMTKSAPLTNKTDPFQIHRTAIGIEIPTHLLRYQLCGLIDIAYLWHRVTIRRLIGHDCTSKKRCIP